MQIDRVSTEYVDREDRIRLICEGRRHEVVTLWLTQRLLNRILPHLLRWVESPAVRAFGAQDHAGVSVQRSRAEPDPSRAERKPSRAEPQPARDDASPILAEWLVDTIDISSSDRQLLLTFKASVEGANMAPAMLVLRSGLLREWLRILKNEYAKAGWPLTEWTAAVPGDLIGLAAKETALLH